MNNLSKILDILEDRKSQFKGTYYIPEAWNTCHYSPGALEQSKAGQINVNPYEFISQCINSLILTQENRKRYLNNSAKEVQEPPNLVRSVIYSVLPRMLTAWTHEDNERLQGGTFLKTICLLPYIKELGADIIYLLPIFKYSSKYKKGEIGSPYAIKNIYKLDANLHDELLGGDGEEMIDLEFKAFVEACHLLDMKVMVDFVFRTVSRDNDLIAEHPEWFYWIDIRNEQSFTTPKSDKLKGPTLLNDKSLKSLYTSSGIKEYLAGFTYPPNAIDSDKWGKVLKKHYETGDNILDLIEADFGITTAPGFSNVVNDTQPPWTDVTYLKFYFDLHPMAKKYVGSNQAPYILQDGVSLNLYRGEEVNAGLWDYISGVIRHYQQCYGIDGARIDMGHALPPELNKRIVTEAKAGNRSFILWSEEFHAEKSKAAGEEGFHFLTGMLWGGYKDIDKPSFNKKIFRDAVLSHLPLTGALETPDTPRIALRYRDKRKIELALWINAFVPNSVPLINSGMELMELQPMNLGLDNTEEGRFVLEEKDCMYGKLAFFDNYCLHWLQEDGKWMRQLLKNVFRLRSTLIDYISHKDKFIEESIKVREAKLTFMLYHDTATGRGIFLLANRSLKSGAKIRPGELLVRCTGHKYESIDIIYDTDGAGCRAAALTEGRLMKPGEVIIGSVV